MREKINLILDKLIEMPTLCKWRVTYYDNGAEEYETFIEQKQFVITVSEMGTTWITAICLRTNKVNKVELESDLKDKALLLLKDIENKGTANESLWEELLKDLQSWTTVYGIY
jgi:hypothetical protein